MYNEGTKNSCISLAIFLMTLYKGLLKTFCTPYFLHPNGQPVAACTIRIIHFQDPMNRKPFSMRKRRSLERRIFTTCKTKHKLGKKTIRNQSIIVI